MRTDEWLSRLKLHRQLLHLLDLQVEAQMDLIDENGDYPCCYCETRHNPDHMIPVSGNPATPLMCLDCADAMNEQNAAKR